MTHEELIDINPGDWRDLIDWSYVFYYLRHRKNLNGPALAKKHNVTSWCVMGWRNKRKPSKGGAVFLLEEMEIKSITPFLKERI